VRLLVVAGLKAAAEAIKEARTKDFILTMVTVAKDEDGDVADEEGRRQTRWEERQGNEQRNGAVLGVSLARRPSRQIHHMSSPANFKFELGYGFNLVRLRP
jgi:hypothetical protein